MPIEIEHFIEDVLVFLHNIYTDVEIGFTASEHTIGESELAVLLCLTVTRGELERNISAQIEIINEDTEGDSS